MTDFTFDHPPALAGIRVLDLSQGIAGPYCTVLLAAHGADVIKLEPPGGDWLRHSRTMTRGQAPTAIAMNTGKRSIVLDLKDRQACETARRIAATCDVVVENFRPGVVQKFGLDYEAVRAERPDVVYCSITGFGQHGAMRDRPVIDNVCQAYSGWMWVNAGEDGVPQRTRNVAIADQVTALYAYQAISSALIRRFRFGQGARLDVTLAGSMAAFLAVRLTAYGLSDGRLNKTEFMPPTGEFVTRDGMLVLAVMREPDVERLLALLGRSELLADERFACAAARVANKRALHEELARTLVIETAAHWEACLAGQGVMACAVRDLGGFLKAQEADGLALVETIESQHLGACPVVRIPGAPSWRDRDRVPEMPLPGQHTEQILQELALFAGRQAGSVPASS